MSIGRAGTKGKVDLNKKNRFEFEVITFYFDKKVSLVYLDVYTYIICFPKFPDYTKIACKANYNSTFCSRVNWVECLLHIM